MFEILIILNAVFIIGTVLGSFIGVVVERLYREEQFLSGKSYCERCKKPLQWRDMIPVVSYILLRGRCRYCKVELSTFLPIIEILTGLISASIFYISFVGFNDELIFSLSAVYKFTFLLLVFVFLEIIFFMDAKYMVIPVIPVYLIAIIYTLYGFIVGTFPNNLMYSLYGALLMFLFFAGIHFFSKGQMMGDGDIYIATVLGFVLALDLSLLMWLLAFVLGSFYAIYLMLTSGAGLRNKVPFGPFIIISFIISYSIGNTLLNLYYSFLL